MGVVYEARDNDRGVHVALKTLKNPGPEALIRLKREFRALQDIHHPNLVSLGELIEDGGRWFFTMELVRGEPFLAWIRHERGAAQLGPSTSSGHTANLPSIGRPSLSGIVVQVPPVRSRICCDLDRLRQGLRQLTRGLAHLHDAGKVHRDVKPANLIVEADERVVLFDFGLVVEVEPMADSSEHHIVGTALYMAPEQAAARRVTPAADWYSLGVVLFEALTGQLPFQGASLEILMAKQQREPPPPSALVDGVPDDLDRLCAELLRHDPERRPGPAVILRRLGQEGRTPGLERLMPAASTHAPSFVGRDDELARLREAFADTAAKTPHPISVIVQGESGVGKTSLVRRLCSELGEAGAVVLAGRCYERESVPYKAFDGVIDALAGYLQRRPRLEVATLVPPRASLLLNVFPVLRRVEPLAQAPAHPVADMQELRARAFTALRALFVLLSERHPVIIAIDDLQWADADSLALLGELVRPPEAPRLLLLCTWRPVSAGAEPPTLPGEVRHLSVGRLPEKDAVALATRLLGRDGQTPLSAATIAREADGHPLFIDELVRYAQLKGEPSQPTSTPTHLEDAFWARIERLEPTAIRVLQVVALASSPLKQEVAARAVALDLSELTRVTSLLRVMNLVRTTGVRGDDTVEPYHDRVRAAILARLSAADRLQRHLELAHAHEGSPQPDAEALAVHLREAGERSKAAVAAESAGAQAAASLAFERAARLFKLALELEPAEPATRRRLWEHLGDALAHAGRAGEAARAYLAATEGQSAMASLDLRLRAGMQFFGSGLVDDGLATMRTALASEDVSLPATPGSALATVILYRVRLRLRGLGFKLRDEKEIAARDLSRIDMLWQAGSGLALVDTVLGNAFHGKGLLLALRAGEPYRLTRALAVEANFLSAGGTRAQDRVEKLIAVVEKLSHQSGHPHAIAMVHGSRGFLAFLTGRFARAAEQLSEAERILREKCRDVHWETNTARLYTARSLLNLGRLADLSRRLPLALEECRRRGDRFGATSLRVAVVPHLQLAADDVEAARGEPGAALQEWSAKSFHLQHFYALLSSGSVSLYESDGEAALETLRRQQKELERSLLLRVQFVRMQLHDLRGRASLAAAGKASGEARKAFLRAAEKESRLVRKERAAWTYPLASIVEAGVARARGHEEAGVRLLSEAANGFDQGDMALHAHATRYRLGELIGGEDGAALRDRAATWMRAEGIVDLGRFVDMLVPTVAA